MLELATKPQRKIQPSRSVRGLLLLPALVYRGATLVVRRQGQVIDPSCLQFPSAGLGIYILPSTAPIECSNCGKTVSEEEADIDGRYVFAATCAMANLLAFIEDPKS